LHRESKIYFVEAEILFSGLFSLHFNKIIADL
jgi:hypothetical protein